MVNSITVAGGDLFRIAAEQLGDARQWWRLAEYNGLQDPVVIGLSLIKVPALNQSLSTGLPPT